MAWHRPHSRSRSSRSAVEEVRYLHEVEHEGESEWTPVIALVGLFVFLLTIELLTFGVVEGTLNLVAAA